MNRLLATSLFLLIGGCAGEPQLRSVSSQSAAIMTTYKTSLRGFAASQTSLNASTEGRINRFKAMRQQRAAEIAARVDGWRYARNEEALRKFEVIGGVGADEMLRAANPQLPPAALPALKYDGGETEAVIKQLVDLQKPPTLRQRLIHLAGFGVAVRDSFNKDVAEATKQSGEAAAVASDAEAATEKTAEEGGS